jgi:hypothetical protein
MACGSNTSISDSIDSSKSEFSLLTVVESREESIKFFSNKEIRKSEQYHGWQLSKRCKKCEIANHPMHSVIR